MPSASAIEFEVGRRYVGIDLCANAKQYMIGVILFTYHGAILIKAALKEGFYLVEED